MLSEQDFVRDSLELHLFFTRIMKEHSFFLQLEFTPKNYEYTQHADYFRRHFDLLLGEVIQLSKGIVSDESLESGEVITPFTQNAEMASAYYTGVNIPIVLTQAEADLSSEERIPFNQKLVQDVYSINQRLIKLTSELIQFKSVILTNVLSCNIFTGNYPLLIDHIMREAKLYLQLMQILQNGKSFETETTMMEQEIFWNKIMAEHAKFIRGLLDPSEDELIQTANHFGNEFDELTAEAMQAQNRTMAVEKVTEDSLEATRAIRDFKTQGTQGILECKVKSIIIPLLGDHTLREANHYFKILRRFLKE